jgi:hypothetical protein
MPADTESVSICRRRLVAFLGGLCGSMVKTFSQTLRLARAPLLPLYQ